MKNRRIGAAANPNKKNGNWREKSTKTEKRGPNPLIWGPAAYVNSALLLKHPLTLSPTQKKAKKSD